MFALCILHSEPSIHFICVCFNPFIHLFTPKKSALSIIAILKAD